MCKSLPQTSPDNSGIYVGEELERLKEPEVADDLKKTVLPRPDREKPTYELTVTSCIDFHKFKSEEFPVEERVVSMNPHS